MSDPMFNLLHFIKARSVQCGFCLHKHTRTCSIYPHISETLFCSRQMQTTQHTYIPLRMQINHTHTNAPAAIAHPLLRFPCSRQMQTITKTMQVNHTHTQTNAPAATAHTLLRFPCSRTGRQTGSSGCSFCIAPAMLRNAKRR